MTDVPVIRGRVGLDSNLGRSDIYSHLWSQPPWNFFNLSGTRFIFLMRMQLASELEQHHPPPTRAYKSP